MFKNAAISILSLVLVSGFSANAAAEKLVSDPVRAAVEKMYDVDANGQAFTLSVAAAGGAGAIGLGAWLLHERPLASDGKPAPLLFSNALILATTGVGQFVHGFMRLGERQASSAMSRLLLDDPAATEKAYLNYLRYRADQSKVTRFVGAVLTTLQGVASIAAGLEMALTDGSQHTTTGWVIASLGVVGTGIGSVHFFGKTRAQRELHKALHPEQTASHASLEVAPSVVLSPQGSAVPALVAFGTF